MSFVNVTSDDGAPDWALTTPDATRAVTVAPSPNIQRPNLGDPDSSESSSDTLPS